MSQMWRAGPAALYWNGSYVYCTRCTRIFLLAERGNIKLDLHAGHSKGFIRWDSVRFASVWILLRETDAWDAHRVDGCRMRLIRLLVQHGNRSLRYGGHDCFDSWEVRRNQIRMPVSVERKCHLLSWRLADSRWRSTTVECGLAQHAHIRVLDWLIAPGCFWALLCASRIHS